MPFCSINIESLDLTYKKYFFKALVSRRKINVEGTVSDISSETRED